MNTIESTVDLHLNNRNNLEFRFDYDKLNKNIGQIHYSSEVESDCIAIYLIDIQPEFRKRGLFTNLIKYITEHPKINKIFVFQPAVITCLILLSRPFNNRFFTNLGTGELVWVKNDKIQLFI